MFCPFDFVRCDRRPASPDFAQLESLSILWTDLSAPGGVMFVEYSKHEINAEVVVLPTLFESMANLCTKLAILFL